MSLRSGIPGVESESARLQRFRDWFIATTDSTWWELAVGAIAILFVWVSFLEEQGPSNTPARWLEGPLTVFFLAEFLSRLAASRDRTEHLVEHWIDAVALFPVVRGLRVLRLLRLVRLAAGVHRASRRVKRLERIRTLVTLVIAWIVVMVVGAVSFYAGEAGINPAVHDFADALWWAVTTITGGQSEIVAVTEDGRWASATLLVGGVALFAAITASVLALFNGEARHVPERSWIGRDVESLLQRRDAAELSQEEFDRDLRIIVGRPGHE